MNFLKRRGLVAIQLSVVLAAIGATGIMFQNPESLEHMLAEVARGLSGGLLLAGVKVLVVAHRPSKTVRPISGWYRFGLAAVRRELKYGLVVGYLLGLIVAMWVCWCA